MSERSLVAFTLLTQTAVGSFLALGALDLWAARLLGDPAYAGTATWAFVAAFALTVAALLASLLHLGAPLNAWRAASNLRTSWLSREILLSLLFAGGAGFLALLRLTGSPASAARTVLEAGTAACGAALVYAMARTYAIRTVPAWHTPRTTVSFFATAVLLGALAVGAALAFAPGIRAGALAGPMRCLALAAAAGLAAELTAGLGAPGVRDGAERRLRHLQRALLAAAFLMCVPPALGAGPSGAFAAAALAAALAAQVLGRYLFYVVGVRRVL